MSFPSWWIRPLTELMFWMYSSEKETWLKCHSKNTHHGISVHGTLQLSARLLTSLRFRKFEIKSSYLAKCAGSHWASFLPFGYLTKCIMCILVGKLNKSVIHWHGAIIKRKQNFTSLTIKDNVMLLWMISNDNFQWLRKMHGNCNEWRQPPAAGQERLFS